MNVGRPAGLMGATRGAGAGAPSRFELSVIARVQPLTRTRAIRGPFDYALSPDQTAVGVGSVLRVPFGGRRSLGVVVAMANESELADDRLAQPDEVLAASIPADLVALAEWMALEYCSTPARALSLVLAPGTAEGVRARRSLTAELTPAGREALQDSGAVLTAGQRLLLQRLHERGPSVAAQLGTPALRRLEDRGLVALETQIRLRRPVSRPLGRADAIAPLLTPDQTEVLGAILAALPRAVGPSPANGDPLLLHGVTGSGKTEIYLQAVAATLQAGRSAIVLVPEIALTPRSCGDFRRASATSSRSCTPRWAPASATTSGCGCATAARGSASVRVRRCSPRSPSWG